MDDLLEEGIIFFNAGRYFDAHERWEQLWRRTSGEPRLFLQGLVQVAVGLHHFSRNNRRGGARILGRGVDKLGAYTDTYLGINNALLIKDLGQLLSGSGPRRVMIHNPNDQQ